MIRAARVRANLVALYHGISELDRYRAAVPRQLFEEDADVRGLVEYAVLRALTAALDIAKEWACRSPDDPGRYDSGVSRMAERGLFTTEDATRLFAFIQLRNRLAHNRSYQHRDEVFAILEAPELLRRFAAVVERFLSTVADGRDAI